MSFIYSILLLCLVSTSAHSKSWQLVYGFENILSDTNFLENGDSSALSGSNNFNAWIQELQVRYRNSKEWRYSLGVGFNYVSTYTSNFERTNLRLSDVRAGADYNIHAKWGKTSLGVEARLSTFSVDADTDEALISSGANQLHAYARYHNTFWNRLGFLAQLGYLYRDQGLSNLANTKLEVQLLSMPIVIGFGVEQFVSVSDDEYKDNPTVRSTITDRVNAGSYEFYSVNPSKLSAHTWISYSFTPKLTTQLGIRKSMSGKNTSNSQNIFFNLYYSFQDYSYSNDDLGISSYSVDEHGEFKIITEKSEDAELFNERGDRPKSIRKNKEQLKRQKRREKISDPEYEF